MSDPTIKCPNCRTEIRLTEQLAAPIVEATKQRYREHLNQELEKVELREAKVREELQRIADDRKSLEDQLEARLVQERRKIADEEARKAKLRLQEDMNEQAAQITALNDALKQQGEKLSTARQAQAALLQQKRELEEAKESLELTVEQRVQETLSEVKERAKKEAEDALQLKVREKEHQIESMQRQIEELKRKADQGSQQLQGEVLELELEETLRRMFPLDLIEPVQKGEAGGDIIQRVMNARGSPVGSILWETKRTKNWQEPWLAKVRADQRRVGCDHAVIVSQALPKGIETFDGRDEVWVTSPHCVIPIASMLREWTICVHGARKANEGQATKQAMVYQYLTGPRFGHRMRALLEQYANMKRDLDQERRAFSKQWAKRDQQLQCVSDTIAGVFGDLQGMAGQSMEELEGLSLRLLDGPAAEDAAVAA